MTRRVSGRELDDDGTVSEHVMVLVMNDKRLRIFQFAVVCWLRLPRACLSEHGVPLGFLYDPGRSRKLVRIRREVRVVMRHREVSNVRWLIANGRQLRQQFLRGCEHT